MCKGRSVFVACWAREVGAPRSLTGLTCRLGDARRGNLLAGQPLNFFAKIVGSEVQGSAVHGSAVHRPEVHGSDIKSELQTKTVKGLTSRYFEAGAHRYGPRK